MDSAPEAVAAGPVAKRAASPAAQQEGSLTNLYDRYFEVVPADTADRLDAAYRLRYQVYCVENPFENADEHPDGREVDPFDERSVHSLLIHKPTGAVAGTVRLVLPQAGKELPITHSCDHPTLRDPSVLPPGTTAEISRFAVSKQFRRRATDKVVADYGYVERPTAPVEFDRRVMPHITLGLMKAITQMSWERGITHWTAVMEPALLRLIGRLGLEFTPLGPLVSYHGQRQPCYGDANAVLAGMRQRQWEAWALITDTGDFFPQAALDPPLAAVCK